MVFCSDFFCFYREIALSKSACLGFILFYIYLFPIYDIQAFL